ncbi:MAG: acylphosphatase [Betaproteobacteria bacterium]|nr:acylphosphatase [Betaproteobacteria bacterium]
MNERACRRLRIRGLVQGVGFRYSLQREAILLGLSGWVRNRRDGTVEAVVAGPAEAVEAIVAWSHRGPPSARVEAVVVTVEEGRFEGFELQPTV